MIIVVIIVIIIELLNKIFINIKVKIIDLMKIFFI